MNFSKFEFPWPKTQALITGDSPPDFSHFNTVKNLILENPECYISEKLDGCNFCVSSKGYVASRNTIVSHNQSDLKSMVFHKTSLHEFLPILNKVRYLNNELAAKFDMNPNHLETLLYGEFMLAGGTSQSQYDVYDYHSRGFQPGKFYAFGIGLVTEEERMLDSVKSYFNDCNFTQLDSVVPLTKKGEEKEGKKYIVVPLNAKVKSLMDEFDIEHVPMKKYQDSLFNILTRKQINIALGLRKVEGYVINTPHRLFKLKYRETKDERRNEFFKQLHEAFPFNSAVENLKKIYDSCDDFCPMHSCSLFMFNRWFLKVAHDFNPENLTQLMKENIDEVGCRTFSNDTKAILRIFMKRIILEILKEQEGQGYTKIDPHLKQDLRKKLSKKISNMMVDMDKQTKKDKINQGTWV